MLDAGVSGMAIKSKCLKYEIKSKSCSRPDDSSSKVPRVLDEVSDLAHHRDNALMYF